MDDNPERPAATDGDGRLNVQVLLGDALASPVDVLLGGFADRPDQIALVTAQVQFRADAKQGGERDTLDEPPGVVRPCNLMSGNFVRGDALACPSVGRAPRMG